MKWAKTAISSSFYISFFTSPDAPKPLSLNFPAKIYHIRHTTWFSIVYGDIISFLLSHFCHTSPFFHPNGYKHPNHRI